MLGHQFEEYKWRKQRRRWCAWAANVVWFRISEYHHDSLASFWRNLSANFRHHLSASIQHDLFGELSTQLISEHTTQFISEYLTQFISEYLTPSFESLEQQFKKFCIVLEHWSSRQLRNFASRKLQVYSYCVTSLCAGQLHIAHQKLRLVIAWTSTSGFVIAFEFTAKLAWSAQRPDDSGVLATASYLGIASIA